MKNCFEGGDIPNIEIIKTPMQIEKNPGDTDSSIMEN
jgi:hypothetical protein